VHPFTGVACRLLSIARGPAGRVPKNKQGKWMCSCSCRLCSGSEKHKGKDRPNRNRIVPYVRWLIRFIQPSSIIISNDEVSGRTHTRTRC